jgi:hypothetical protein
MGSCWVWFTGSLVLASVLARLCWLFGILVLWSERCSCLASERSMRLVRCAFPCCSYAPGCCWGGPLGVFPTSGSLSWAGLYLSVASVGVSRGKRPAWAVWVGARGILCLAAPWAVLQFCSLFCARLAMGSCSRGLPRGSVVYLAGAVQCRGYLRGFPHVRVWMGG